MNIKNLTKIEIEKIADSTTALLSLKVLLQSAFWIIKKLFIHNAVLYTGKIVIELDVLQDNVVDIVCKPNIKIKL